MPGTRLAALVRRMRRDAPDPGGCSDADLVARFAATRDEAAFELLVWRHGAMVLAACRRSLGHTEDAEDAFQATFLVLARKAGSVRRGVAVPSWLHRVAVRIARRAARTRRPTAALEAEPPARAEPDPAERAELRGILDAEIDRLSEPLRRAVVLCYLEGLSNADAARALGCPVGTIESRLTAARRALRDRLAGRVALPAGALAVLGCQPVLSAAAVGAVARAGSAVAAGGLRAAVGIVPEPAVRLAKGALAMTKVRMVVAGVLGASLLGLAAGVGWANRPTEPPAERAPQPPIRPDVTAAPRAGTPPTAPMPKPKAADVAAKDAWPLARQFKLSSDSTLIGVTPDGKQLLMLSERGSDHSVYGVSFLKPTSAFTVRSENVVLAAAMSPDGKLIATAEGANGVKLRDVTSGKAVEALWPEGDLPAVQVAFAANGAKLVVLCAGSDGVSYKGGGFGLAPGQSKVTQVTRVSVWDLTTRKELGHPAQTTTGEPSTLPRYTLAGHGRFVLQTQAALEGGMVKSRRFVVTDAVTGTAGKPVEVAGATLRPPSDPLSPDGKTLVLVDYAPNLVRFLDVGTGQDRFRVPAFRRPVKAVAFSPDGRLVAAATGVAVSNAPDAIAAPSEVVIWDAATGKEVARLADKETIRDHTALAFSPDGSFLAAQAYRAGVTIWGHPPTPPPPPAAPKAVTKAPSAAEAPARFQSLFRDLSGEVVTDARRVEVLFVAALGRFPTDVEARTLAAQLARRDDKAAALRDLLGTLAETAEFKAHAEELNRLAK